MTDDTQTNKKKVLLVDDDQFLLNMYAIKFRNSGFEVETHSSGEAALKTLREGARPDVVLVDIVMPGMDGLEFIRRFKQEGLSPFSTLIMLSNQGQSADIDKAKALGAAGYIVKAATVPSEVVEEVNDILSKKQ